MRLAVKRMCLKMAMAAWHQGGWLMVGGLASVLAIMALLVALRKTQKASWQPRESRLK
ncbi:hypothetical protein [Pectobacterium brasiliense]|uniref:hypothetical protein n=1 Tax=Pectobacterium brasiliense TaxID=180957 RepID=UPI00196976BD|nr:hypothetical protein [Pectobacterium brasiliense]